MVSTVIDLHAHVTPERYRRAIEQHGTWHGLGPGARGWGAGWSTPLGQRLDEMDAMGVDLQLITPNVGFYQYGNALATTVAIARDCNDDVAETVAAHPTRFAGLATLPMQDVPAAIEELERAVTRLGHRGCVISDHVAGRTYDDPTFLPFFQAAEALGALVFFHQGGDTCVDARIPRYELGNAVGNLTERTLAFAALVFGGVLDACPDLRPMLAHGGGYVALGIGRLDKIAGALEGGYPEHGLEPPFAARGTASPTLRRAPSEYLRRFTYDSCVYSGPALRFLIDTVGADRVVLGTDYPAPMVQPDPVAWVRGLDCLTPAEQEAVLGGNAQSLLSLSTATREGS